MAPPRLVPDLRTMELVVAVSSEGSIGAAARRLDMSQQAASQRLRAFERSLGLPLLERGSRGSALTPDGRAVAEWGVRLVASAHEVETAVAALRAERRASLRVAASLTVAEHLLPRWLVDLRRSERGHGATTSVSLRALNSGHVVDALEAGEADLGFVEGPEPPADLPSTPVHADRLVLVVAPDDDLARRPSITPRALAASALTAREPGSGTREVLEVALGRLGLTAAAPAVELATTTAIRETVRAGGAPAVLSELAVRADLASGALVRVAVKGLDLSRTLRAVWVGGSEPASGVARALLEVAAGSQPSSSRSSR